MYNYLVVALRNLNRERLYAAINIAGLALGIACCLILGLFLRSELTYDLHNVKHKQIYRVVNEFTTKGGSADRFAPTSRALGPVLKESYPEVKAFVRFQKNSGQGGVAIHHKDDTYFWDNSYFVDDNVFEVFTHDVIYGDPKTALKDGASVAVSQTFARKYFGDANPIGESITTDGGIPTKITLVFADLPPNTHLKYDILFSSNLPFLRESDNPTMRRNQLWNIGNFTYLLMDPDFDPASWERINDDFYTRNMEALGKTIGGTWHSWLQPLADIHLKSDLGYDEPIGNRIYLYGCAAVALFILAVACINYMNLATARATRRVRSVGIRKILGASRVSLCLQFLGEAVFFSLIALVLGVVLVEMALTLTPLNSLMGQQVSLNLIGEPTLLAWLIGLGVLMGLLAGAYPAFYLSSWAPLSAMTGRHLSGKGHLRLREALVLLQFTISAGVIACTLLMAAQMRYVANKSLGFEKENRLVVTLRSLGTIEKIATIRTELGKNGNILGVAEAQATPGQNTGINIMQVDNNEGVLTTQTITNMPIGTDFLKVMGLKLATGRDISQRLLTDVGQSIIVNEALVRKMGWTEPLGKRIQAGNQSGRVIGVVQDFNFKSLHTLIEPFAMYPINNDFSQVSEINKPFMQRLLVVNISGNDVSQTLGHIESVMQKADPKHPFEYTFLDQQLDNLYKSDQRLTKLTGIFAAICIFIACLGLFGLAAYTTEQRTREIGTRKVLGATTWQIIMLLSRRILILVVVASALASVAAYFAMDEWLAGFAYRTGINPLVFLLSAAAAAAVAFATVAMQSYKTASADPVNALRYE
ncbi:MAG TPA: ABC transporter permease [Steroidobacteraceae bacterium]|nr:ABC transporter permease [Steroidobacteraceae bacterium]